MVPKGSLSPHPHLYLLSLVFLMIAILLGVSDIPMCFLLTFPWCDDQWCQAPFHVSVGHLNIFLGKIPIHVLWHFKIGWVFATDLYMFFYITLDIDLLSSIWFANTCSHSEGCCFILSIVSLAVQKPFSLVQSSLIFALAAHAFGVISLSPTKVVARPVSKIFPIFF